VGGRPYFQASRLKYGILRFEKKEYEIHEADAKPWMHLLL